MISRMPAHIRINRYGAPAMSSRLGSHHVLFNQVTGLTKHPAAPRHPPIREIVAAGFFCLTHEQTVILLKTMTPAARANNRHAMNQRKGDLLSMRERTSPGFLVSKIGEQLASSGELRIQPQRTRRSTKSTLGYLSSWSFVSFVVFFSLSSSLLLPLPVKWASISCGSSAPLRPAMSDKA